MGNRMLTGIAGLDELLQGGLRQGSSVLVTGAPGTGKSILALQFIVAGAKLGEPGLFISAEESASQVRENAAALGLPLERYEKEGKITLIEQEMSSKKLVSIATPLAIIKKKGIKRVALDSLTLFGYMHVAGEADYRREVLSFIQTMKEAGVTLFATSEKTVTDTIVMQYQAEDFLFDGMIMMIAVRRGASFERVIHIVKMRGQNHLLDMFPFKIGSGGITIFPDQIPFALAGDEERKKR
ncbi:MAG TPA: ATPase domain-containing protein [Candidatus Nanoarchaeia archaeon]|nr:ATPase domain-containing protein [Candidatus Nanoarchaeia archaeon]